MTAVIKKMDLTNRARDMVSVGYISQIIELETGLSYKQIRKIRNDLKLAGNELAISNARTIRTGSALIHCHSSKLQASILMQLYVNIGSHSIYKSINIDALYKAFLIYRSILQELQYKTDASWHLFDISDAWCLAKELRTNNAIIELCKSCHCNFYTSFNQNKIISCPFCQNNNSRYK
ncbi:MAG: FlhC family transcriptional regulator [Shewanella sp.]